MFKKTRLVLAVVAMVSLFQACRDREGGAGDFNQTASGLDYQLYTQDQEGNYTRKNAAAITADTAGLSDRIGQIMTLRMKYRNSEDSVLFSTYERNMPVQIEMMRSPVRGSIEEAFLMLTPGDSAVFRINADTLFARTFQQPLPPFIQSGSDLTFNIKAVKLQSREEAMAEFQTLMKQRYDDQMSKDEETIKAYLSEKGLDAQRTTSGVYYVVTKKGAGKQPESGNTVKVHYTGTTLDGNVFDSSKQDGREPLEFPLGRGAVIQGWDEGIAALRQGDHAVLIIPSPLAYGEEARGPDMPANSILRFDVELLNVQ
jgi:FKBP-type peptidyl-prolyl cis-trans isomerase FkpA